MDQKAGPAPVKGCSTCTKRRIRCDGGRPTCFKCEKKGLECPGYGPRLRWADGMAIRGKLKGRLPFAQQTKSQLQAGPAATSQELMQRMMPTSSPDMLQTTLSNSLPQLIEYYDKNLAGLMVWVDSAENAYRRTVLPRVTNTPGLRLAVAAFASHHGSSRFQHAMELFPEAARDACLGMIHTRVQDMTSRLTNGVELDSQTDIADAEWMLACILMIACYEMSNSQASAAEGHRLAARTLVNVFGSKRGYSNGLFAFLRNQLAIYDVLVSTTSFSIEDIRNTIMPTPGSENVLFADYLTHLHQVTLASRYPSPIPEEVDALITGVDFAPDSIRARFTQARGATLIAAGRLGVEKAVMRQDFVRLVDVYHYAAVLYSYRCLGYATTDNMDWQPTVNKLFAQLLRFQYPGICMQNLPWPIFVAGTECWGDARRQQTVRELLGNILAATNFRHYEGVLGFLNAFWSGNQPDWRPLAKDLQVKGFRILVI
ncbi:Fungal transcriptional regulatory protein [Cordyceps militaris CM01]|uniref:Fungal transcriptional regulatory protein n=1 Tax=Cordyceps militaris (strain CM01) TaxID=983644 RepID=G3JQZ8_CORMM|nr:Fungal transcriptional regulatory protein [Cordyceps militaris CM01]EGX89442.1 Fungal transcriptional regulatory protein [Cordyceps militaris CM01]